MSVAIDHIVLVSLDTLRSDAIAVSPDKLWPQKYPRCQAPATAVLDWLVGQAAFFPNCVSAAPYTSSSHATILSGRWPRKHGVFEFFNRKLARNPLFEAAQRAGFRTILKTDFPLILGRPLGFDRAVDQFIVEDDSAVLDAFDSPAPSVSLIHFAGIHVPYGFHNLTYGGNAYRNKVKELEAELGAGDYRPADQLVETYRDEEDMQYLLRYKMVIERLWHMGQAERIFGLYLEGLEHFLRTRFAPFTEKLLRKLRNRRWLLVLFGDHGEEYDEESFGHFNSVAEGVLRVPVLMLGADVRPAVHRERVRTVDILPTIADLVPGLRIRTESLDGLSLARAVVEGVVPASGQAAVAQAYVADTRRFIQFQQQMLARGAKRGSLPHVLFREAAYAGPYKLRRQHYDYSGYLGSLTRIDTVSRLERFGPDWRPVAVEDESRTAHLSALLDRYNDSARLGAEEFPAGVTG